MAALRVLPYLRQSEARAGESDASESLSLDGQSALVHERAAREGWHLLPEIRDHDVLGKDPDRPGIRALKETVARGGVDAVVVFALSRFARDFVWQEITYRELHARGVEVISLTEANVENLLVRGITGVVNQHRTEELSIWLRMAFAQRAKRGQHHGTAPFGYRRRDVVMIERRDGTTVPRQTGPLVLDETEASIVERVYAETEAGRSTWEIADALTREGLMPRRAHRWQPGQIRDILINPVYRGAVVLDGEVAAEHAHPALIEPARWEAVQRRRRRWPVVRRKDTSSWLEGKIIHACGGRMYLYPNRPYGRTGKTYGVFMCRTMTKPRSERCGLRPLTCSARKLERAALVCLRRDLIAQIDIDAALARAQHRAESDETAANRRALERQRDHLGERRARVQQGWEMGLYAPAEAADRLAVLDHEAAEIAAALAALPERPAVPDYRAAATLLGDVAQLIGSATTDELAAILESLGVVEFGPHGVRLRYHMPYCDYVERPILILPS